MPILPPLAKIIFISSKLTTASSKIPSAFAAAAAPPQELEPCIERHEKVHLLLVELAHLSDFDKGEFVSFAEHEIENALARELQRVPVGLHSLDRDAVEQIVGCCRIDGLQVAAHAGVGFENRPDPPVVQFDCCHVISFQSCPHHGCDSHLPNASAACFG